MFLTFYHHCIQPPDNLFHHAELHIIRSSYHTTSPNIYWSTVDICDGSITGRTQYHEFQVLSLSCGDVIVM